MSASVTSRVDYCNVVFATRETSPNVIGRLFLCGWSHLANTIKHVITPVDCRTTEFLANVSVFTVKVAKVSQLYVEIRL